jgi:hypothetical protein
MRRHRLRIEAGQPPQVADLGDDFELAQNAGIRRVGMARIRRGAPIDVVPIDRGTRQFLETRIVAARTFGHDAPLFG